MLKLETEAQRRALSRYIRVEYYCKFVQFVRLRKILIKIEPHGCRAYLKGYKGGHAVIAYFKAKTLTELMLHVGEMINTTAVTWHPDRFP